MKRENDFGDIPEYKEILSSIEIQHRKKKRRWVLPVVIASAVVLLLVGTVISLGYSLIDSIHKIDEDEIIYAPSDISSGSSVSVPESSGGTIVQAVDKEELLDDSEVVSPEVQSLEDQVINILLIGEEGIYDDGLGRSDSSLILTINKEQRSLKLTSIMRDILVKIPGYLDNKLNSAYHNGGGKLLRKTIERNFGIQIDGYVIVNFEGFEDIIDKLGGVEIELTEAEAEYLNTHNYISKKKYRNVVPGKQVLNGNQALGYCRVRYVISSDHQAGDFGRTERQRRVLLTLFDKYKSQNPMQMMKIAQKLLEYVSTNLDNAEILEYITEAIMLGCDTMETLNIPVEAPGSYDGGTAPAGLGKAWVFQIDWDMNRAELINFIYGSSHMAEMGADSSKLVSTDSETAAKQEKEQRRERLASSGYGTRGKVVNQTKVTSGVADEEKKQKKEKKG